MHGISSHLRIVSVALAALMLASGAGYAQNHFERSSRGEAYNARMQEKEFFGHASRSAPDDFVSSHVCVNGYRYITRNIDPYAPPAQNAIPVRC